VDLLIEIGSFSSSSSSVAYCACYSAESEARRLIETRTLFFLFYFNRLFATLVSYGLRAYTWHKYRVYIDIQALQISFLGGRIFFKGFRYHGENETILVHSGYITWRYWLRNVKNVDCSRIDKSAISAGQDDDSQASPNERSRSVSGGERGGVKEVDDLPCRIGIKAIGLEWFVYNRSPAYDGIVSAMQESEKANRMSEGKRVPTASSSSEQRSQSTKFGRDETVANSFDISLSRRGDFTSSRNSAGEKGLNEKDDIFNPIEPIRTSASDSSHLADAASSHLNDSSFALLSILPMWVNCQKGAMVLGNEHTKSIFTVTFDSAQGHIDAGVSGPLDHYKQIFDFEIKHPVVQMKPNHDYRHSPTEAAEGLNDVTQHVRDEAGRRHFNWRYHNQKRRIWHTFRDLVPYFQGSVDAFHPISPNSKPQATHMAQGVGLPGETRWLGLTRYLDDNDRDDHEGWDSVEYARFSTIVDCPNVNMRFFWDTPGTVPLASMVSPVGERPRIATTDINGDEPPEWGLNLVVYGGIVNYGPWADRQRAEIQSVFFPNSYRDAFPARRLRPGTSRLSTVFKIHVEIEEETILRVPTREDSKDWQWKGRAEAVKGASTLKKQKEKKHHGKSKKSDSAGLGPDIRPFGWFTVRVAPDSTINYTMDVVANDFGYRNQLDLDLRGSTLSSSVNHGILWRSGPQSVSCDLSNPLGWNELHRWAFNIESHDTEIFLLRDHMFLITDLVNDWTSGPGPDFYTFTPFEYNMNLNFFDFKLYLNCNDSNIINQPDDLELNVFLVLGGKELNANLAIPAVNFSPSQNALDFTAAVQEGQMNLLTPVWNTQHTFLADKTVGALKHLVAKGRYSYSLGTSPAFTDSLLLDLCGTAPTLRLHGFLIRYFMKLKDNYFGDDLHFRTLEEFQDILIAQKGVPGKHPAVPHKISNDLDVILKVRADRISVLMPANLYSCKDTTKFDVTTAEADMRFTNYYMDLDVIFSPLEASLKSFASDDDNTTDSVSSTQLFIDGAHIYGHRLFGLPPTEPTYVCNWDFQVGRVRGECSSLFVRTLALGVGAFIFSLDDDENALPLFHMDILHDITFLQLRVESVRLWLLVEQAALLVGTGPVELKLDDWAGPNYSERLKICVPDLTLAAVNRQSAARHRVKPHPPVTTHAYFQTTVDVRMIERKPNFATDRHQQQHHVRLHDQRTRRTDWLLHERGPIERVRANVHPPAMQYPFMPEPVTHKDLGGDLSVAEFEGVAPKRSLRSKSSFLSLDSSHQSSLNGSVKRRRKHSEGPASRTAGSNRDMSVDEPFSRQDREHHLKDQFADGSVNHAALELPSDPERALFGLPPSSIAYSNSWSSPYFTLDKVNPDLRDVPELPGTIPEQPVVAGGELIDDHAKQHEEESAAHTLFHINCTTGLKGFCAPEFLNAVASLMADLQPAHPSDVLDELQITVMKKILSMGKSRTKPKHITDFSIRLPYAHVRLINSYSEDTNPVQRQQDQYNVILSRTSATVRIREERDPNDYSCVHQQALVLHIIANSVSIGAKDCSADSLNEKVAISGTVNDIVFWLVSDQNTSSKLQFRDIEVSMSSRKLEYLASMVHRTTVMANTIADDFQKPAEEQLKRIRHLAYALTMAGPDIPDPLFLTRPSYVLRAAGDHLRSNDSWKIISRFRYIYHSLPSAARKTIRDRCELNSEECPENGGAQVLASFDQWRTWDLAHVKNSYVMEMIWGSIPGIKESNPNLARQTAISVSIGAMRFLLDPGPKQNEIYIQDLSQQLAINVPLKTVTDMPIYISSSANTTLVQAYCSRIAFRLNWELCELVEDFLKLYLPMEPKSKDPHIPPAPKPGTGVDRYIHVILGTDLGTISLDTVNLKVAMVSKGLRGSMVHRFIENNPDNKATTLVLSSDAASTEFLSNSRVLTLSRLWQPNIYVSFCRELVRGLPEEVLKLAATCKKAQYEIREDVLGLLEVVNRVIGDEVEYIHGMIEKFDFPPSQTPPTVIQKATRKINVATFLDNYSISVALLPSLSFVISGAVARTSIAPTPGSKLVVDLDLKGHTHAFQSRNGDQIRSLSLLDMPPINGRVVVDTSGDVPHLQVYATFERVTLDAAGLQGIINTINRPEIEHVLTNVRIQSQLVKNNFNEIFGRNVPTPRIKDVQPASTVLYRGYITIAGFSIHATAPGIKNKNYSAHLDFNLGLVQLRLSNEGPANGPPLEYPEFGIRLLQILFELRRREGNTSRSCGRVTFGARVMGTSKINDNGETVPSYHLSSDGLEIELFAETASLAVDLAAYLQDRFKSIDIEADLKQLRNLRRLTLMEIPKISLPEVRDDLHDQEDSTSLNLFKAMYSLELYNIRASWIVGGSILTSPGREVEDLVFSIRKIDLSTKKENAARLGIEDLQLQMVPMHSANKMQRSLNSALLPEVVFNVAYFSTRQDRRFAFQAAGKALDLRMTSEFIVPASMIQSSIAAASQEVRESTAFWAATPVVQSRSQKQNLFSSKRLASFLVDADFAGAVVSLQGRREDASNVSIFNVVKGSRPTQRGRYGQFSQEGSAINATLRAPGIALKVEYKDSGLDDPSLNAEIKVDASTNVLYPPVVPLILEISDSVKELVGESEENSQPASRTNSPPKRVQESTLGSSDPSAILGKCRLNVGLWICKQEFSLSCQPIARVAATAGFDDIFMTINTVQSAEQPRFFSLLVSFNKLSASVQHVYSRESTASFDVESIVVSLMNSKHISTANGISAILKVSPMKVQLNAKQVQDFLLFREIWIPVEIRHSSAQQTPGSQSQVYNVQRYQEVAAAGAFLWNATLAIAELDVQVDLGQSLGKTAFVISNFWVSSKKNSDTEQNLCLGFQKIGLDSTGRMSGFIELSDFRVRTSIQWPPGHSSDLTPLIQASLGFEALRVKAAFDYQAFLVADITSFEFLMYNIRDSKSGQNDRLVGILDGGGVQVFCTTNSASQGYALYQAILRLVQEKQTAYEASLKEIEKFTRRKSTWVSGLGRAPVVEQPERHDSIAKTPVSLHTDVVVTLKALTVGAFPSTFFDNQIFKMEAMDAQARFAVSVESNRTHSALGLTLGQLRVALAGVDRPTMPKTLGDISVEDVVSRAAGSKGGIILRVPKVVATMQTWQTALSNHIDYIFNSAFEGKVDVGWNYSRISFIRGMWMNHSRTLAQRLGKPLPQSAVHIKGGPHPEGEGGGHGEEEKITAVVNVPQSKYEYTALEPPIIETPQLRDMGEATPPLEWIGLHRDRLPNVTHQIIIVTLLEVAKEVEDAYSRILGST
jgi:hypothetical protein